MDHYSLNWCILHSTLAGVILFKNDNTVVPVAWYANKIKRLCGSTLQAETLSLMEGLGQAVYVKQVNKEIFSYLLTSFPAMLMWITMERTTKVCCGLQGWVLSTFVHQ